MSNYKDYTFMWQPQPYKSWKGDISSNLFNVVSGILKKPITQAVPTVGGSGTKQRGRMGPHQLATKEPAVTVGRNSRVGHSQNHKIKSQLNHNIAGGVGVRERNFGPQPMKHWRLQLNTVSYDINGNIVYAGVYNKKTVANLIDRPGSAQNINKPNNLPNNKDCLACDPSGNGQFSKQYYERDSLWNINVNFNYPNDKFLDCSTNEGVCKPVCVACNPENNVIKRACTILNKKYYSDTRGYLRSRCRTYDQKQNVTRLADKNSAYIGNTDIPAWPTDQPCGVQTYLMGTCPDKCQSGAELCGKDIPPNPRLATAIYKPSNRAFQHRGPVECSTRISKLKNDTITNNANSFVKYYGKAAANAAKYSSNTNGGYFVKNKQFICQPSLFYRIGNSNLCNPQPTKLGLFKVPGRKDGCEGIYGETRKQCKNLFG